MSDEQQDPAADPYADRRGKSFAEAEGAIQPPSQLQLKELSQELRALVWAVFVDEVKPFYSGQLTAPWEDIFRAKWVRREHRFADEFRNSHRDAMESLKAELKSSDYIAFFDVIQWFLYQRLTPMRFRERIGYALRNARAAYRVVDGHLIVPISDDATLGAFTAAITATGESGMAGAKSHLATAAADATRGRWASSIRESISAVESVARLLAPGSNTLAPALARVAKSVHMHEALNGGFAKIYGFTSDENGIRHALLDKGDANVDEHDAVFMLGACSSFISYLIGKSRTVGLLR